MLFQDIVFGPVVQLLITTIHLVLLITDIVILLVKHFQDMEEITEQI